MVEYNKFKIKFFSLYLESIILKTEKSNNKNLNLKIQYNPSLNISNEYDKYNFPIEFLEVYYNMNGFKINWSDSTNPNYCGGVEFLSIKNLIASNSFFEKEDIANNDLLEYFYAFEVTSDYECGFMITSEETYKSIYYRRNLETHRLELDFSGYLFMAYKSRTYQNWQTVILDIINKEESTITSDFKKCMTYLDEEFSFDEYVEIFNGLRIKK